jgi:hypothetical protein
MQSKTVALAPMPAFRVGLNGKDADVLCGCVTA